MHCLEVPTVPFRLSVVVVVVSIVVVIIIVSCAIVEAGAVFVMILVKNVPLAIVFVVEAISSDYSAYATYRLSDLCPGGSLYGVSHDVHMPVLRHSPRTSPFYTC